eukprot:TRINITY_DN2158_c0_g4_i1.p1 TRINITY_DN2158_c0_g4~~TRINITY_DN2158_c0_g4_i1.p1  ORF type:complete len:100 (+),score=6.60 TRINITY_DN2158_c0_g4_i1:77-376(+)
MVNSSTHSRNNPEQTNAQDRRSTRTMHHPARYHFAQASSVSMRDEVDTPNAHKTSLFLRLVSRQKRQRTLGRKTRGKNGLYLYGQRVQLLLASSTAVYL